MMPLAPVPEDFPYVTAVRLRRPMVADPYSGLETPGRWEDASETEIEGCLFAAGTSDDFPNVDVVALSALGSLYTPLRADITTADRVRVDGAVWDVLGRRSDWDPYGSVVTLKFVREGA